IPPRSTRPSPGEPTSLTSHGPSGRGAGSSFTRRTSSAVSVVSSAVASASRGCFFRLRRRPNTSLSFPVSGPVSAHAGTDRSSIGVVRAGVTSRGAETPLGARRSRQLIDLVEPHGLHSLDHQLSDPVHPRELHALPR